MGEKPKTSRRRFVSASAASLATALVAGCGGNGGEGTTAGPGGGETTGDDGGTTAPGTAETGPTGGTGTGTGTASGTGSTGTPTPTSTFALGAERSGWQGREPDAIAGRTNPTLTLQSGVTYGVTWTNVDGRRHRLVVETASGERVAATAPASEQGATRSVAFQAGADVASYYCEYHPESMRGAFSVFGAETGTATDS